MRKSLDLFVEDVDLKSMLFLHRLMWTYNNTFHNCKFKINCLNISQEEKDKRLRIVDSQLKNAVVAFKELVMETKND
jgi:hypothetical protein